MKIKEIVIETNDEYGKFSFGDNTFISSDKNRSGKTTLMRSIVWAMGIKGHFLTDKIDVKTLKTILTFDNEVQLYRKNDEIKVLRNGVEKQFDITSEYDEFINFAYGLSTSLFEALLFGCYIDQDNGWKVINRGKISPNSSNYNLENLLLLISKQEQKAREYEDLWKRYKGIEKKAIELKEAKKVMRYSAKTIKLSESQEVIISRMNHYNNLLEKSRERLKVLRTSASSDRKFIDFIDNNDVMVSVDGKMHKLTKDSLVVNQFENIWIKREIELVQKNITEYSLKLDELASSISQQLELFNDSNTDNEAIKEFGFLNSKIDNMIFNLKSKRTNIKKTMDNFISRNAKVFNEFIASITEICDFVKVDPRKIISSEKWKGLSGTRRMVLVLSIRVAFNKIAFDQGLPSLPMIIDSPAANEIDDEFIAKINEIIEKIEGQKVIASLATTGIKFESDVQIKLGNQLLTSKQQSLKIEK